VPGAGNTARVPSATGTANYRIPDILDPEARIIGEVKNVSRLSLTAQLRDFIAYAHEHGYDFELYIRRTTQLSGPLKQAVASGQITLRYLP
jgi:Restriction endonuclease fold toxin 7